MNSAWQSICSENRDFIIRYFQDICTEMVFSSVIHVTHDDWNTVYD